MEKIKLWVESQASHMGQIITGFLMLKQQGLDLEIQTDYDGILSHMPVIQAEYRGLFKEAELGRQYRKELEEAELFRKAEAFAIRANGRSPRTAKQFIQLVCAGLK